MNLKVFFPYHLEDNANGHTCLSVCRNMQSEDLRVQVLAHSSGRGVRDGFVRNTIPFFLKRIMYHFDRKARGMIETTEEYRYLKSLKKNDVAYIWPAFQRVSDSFHKRIKEKGNIIVREGLNCHAATLKRILDDAYKRLNWPMPNDMYSITEEIVQREKRDLSLCDYIFAPNPMVKKSLLENGVQNDKILLTSYGWSPERLGINKEKPTRNPVPVFLFVGYLCVRKGIPLLFDIWDRSKIRGKLILVGRVAPDVAYRCADQFRRPDINLLNYTQDINAIYRSSDVFIFPSLEEGGPLATFEAMANYLPLLVSGMGSAGAALDGKHGFVIDDPYDQGSWIENIRKLADDPALRVRMGEAGHESAQQFTWQKVGARRRKLLFQALSKAK